MQRAAGATRPALSIVTDPADILAAVVRQEDVRTPIDLLRTPLQPAPRSGERLEFNVIADYQDEVDVFGAMPVGTDRAEQAHATNASDLDGCTGKVQTRSQKFRAMTGF